MTRHKLGSWTCPSGNSCDVFLVREGRAKMEHVRFEWDREPPLRAADQLFYDVEILPAVIRLIKEYTERVGPTLVVKL